MHDDIAGIDLHSWDLHRAAQENRTDIVQLLIERGAEIDVRDKSNETPLHHAAQANSLGVARLLIEQGAPPDD